MNTQQERVRASAPWGPVPKAPGGHSWQGLMREALQLAAQGALEAEVPVGALVVSPEGLIVGRAHNAPCVLHDPTAHAEVLALREAGKTLGNYRLDGCVLVVSLEPCLMCVGAMVHARIAGLVYGAAESKTGAVESCLAGLDLGLHSHKVWHLGGVCAAESAALLQNFFAACRKIPENPA